MDFNTWSIFWSLCFGLLAVLTVIGNVLAILVFLKQRLRKRAHFLLISLAFADLLVGLFTTPFYIAVNTTLREEKPAVRAFIYADILTGLASICTLAAISLERMYAIGWPLRHRTISARVYKLAIVTPWLFAVMVTSMQVFGNFTVMGQTGLYFAVILSLSIPLLVISIAYCFIWSKQRQRCRMGMRNHNRTERRNKTVKNLIYYIISFYSGLASISTV